MRGNPVRIARFSAGDDVGFGLVDTDDEGNQFVTRMKSHPLVGPIQLTGERTKLEDVRLLSPILPTKIVCIGKNYADHIAEMGGSAEDERDPKEPVVFLKPSTAVVGPNDPVFHPKLSSRVDYEGELAVIIGRLCREVPAERAKDVIFGYTIGNDVTARDLQQADHQWTRAKGFDSFCPLGPWIVVGEEPTDREVRCEVNGEVRQLGRTSQMVFDPATLVSYVSHVMTLLPGDVILTGTPAGVGPLRPGDRVSVRVEGIGELVNPVVALE